MWSGCSGCCPIAPWCTRSGSPTAPRSATCTRRSASLLIERSELLLSVGLWHEARLAAEAAVEMFDRQGRRLGSAEALLLLARTVALDGDPVRAVREGRRAVRLLGRQKRAYWMT